MKIAFIGQKGIPATYGGIEKFTDEVSTRLAAMGHQVTVYARSHYLDGPGKEQRSKLGWVTKRSFVWKNVLVRIVPSFPTKHLDAISHTVLCSLDALVRRYDAVVYQAIGPSSCSFIPRLLSSSKVIVIIHSLDWRRQKWGRLAQILLRAAEYPSTHFPHHLFVLSGILQDYYRERRGRDSEVLPPGIEISENGPRKSLEGLGIEQGKYVLFLNRIMPEKGCHYLLDAFSRIETNCRLVVAGDNSQEPDYFKKLMRDYRDKRIIFLGYVPKDVLSALYSNAFLYVLPSDVEGLPQTLLEAAAYGCPTLASDIPENMQTLRGQGLYFKHGDVESLTEGLKWALSNPVGLRSAADRVGTFVRHTYSWERTCAVLLEGISHA